MKGVQCNKYKTHIGHFCIHKNVLRNSGKYIYKMFYMVVNTKIKFYNRLIYKLDILNTYKSNGSFARHGKRRYHNWPNTIADSRC